MEVIMVEKSLDGSEACQFTKTCHRAAVSTRNAAMACREWESGGCAQAVVETASLALEDARHVVEWIASDEPWDAELRDPETRRSRLAYSAWLLLLAGTDEHGTSG